MALPDFRTWLQQLTQPVVEVTELFDRDGFNEWFRSQITRLDMKHPFPQQERDRLMRWDWVGYVDRALRNSGVKEPDLDPAVHDLIVKIAVRGKLFDIATPEQLIPRFITAVRNAVITMATTRQRNRRRYVPEPVEEFNPPQRAASEADVDLIERFRSYVLRSFGDIVLRVLDHRLAGEDTKDLRRTIPELSSHYAVKQAVRTLKKAALNFAGSDPDLLDRVEKALASEQRMLGKRFAGSGA